MCLCKIGSMHPQPVTVHLPDKCRWNLPSSTLKSQHRHFPTFKVTLKLVKKLSSSASLDPVQKMTPSKN